MVFEKEIAIMVSKKTGLSKADVESLLEIPRVSAMGDYAFPCFILASKLKKNPKDAAQELVAELRPEGTVERIEASGPYVNFTVNKAVLVKHILAAVDNNYGSTKSHEKVILEHTSVNPNASPHVGRVRNSIIGDSIKRILKFCGKKVETRYYINDVSKQVALLALVFKPKDKFNDLLQKYIDISKKVEKDPSLEKQVFELLNKFEQGDKATQEVFKKIVDIAVEGQKNIFSSIGINFDYFDFESKYLKESKHVLKELEKTGKLFEDKQGRQVLNQENTGLENSMKSAVLVLTRSDGTGLYPLRDLAYTIDKCKRGKNIIVLGEDQKLYFEQLKQALVLLRKPFPQPVHYSFVLLKGKGKMSTRRGEVVLLEALLHAALEKAEQEIKKRKTKGDAQKVAIGAIKYAMLRNENNKNIIFDLDQALQFEGETGPYLQYSYARASSILRKSNKKPKLTVPDNSHKITSIELALVKKIAQFPKVVQDAERLLNPSIIANYSYQLAKLFNEFYHTNKVLGTDEEPYRLKLVDTFCTTLKNSLSLLGIDVLDEM